MTCLESSPTRKIEVPVWPLSVLHNFPSGEEVTGSGQNGYTVDCSDMMGDMLILQGGKMPGMNLPFALLCQRKSLTTKIFSNMLTVYLVGVWQH